MNYAPGSSERQKLEAAIDEMKSQLPFEVPCVIDGKDVRSPSLFRPVWPPAASRRRPAQSADLLQSCPPPCLGQDRQRSRAAPAPRSHREAPLPVPRRHPRARRQVDRVVGCRPGRVGGPPVERPRRHLPQGGRPRCRQVSLPADGCYHARPGQERLAGRD
jgi:hypothetical protein